MIVIVFIPTACIGGRAYSLGEESRWFLFVMTLPKAILSYPDHTLEILMTELPEDVLAVFSRNVCKNGRECGMVSTVVSC